jgi:hypothetical protein
MLMHPCCHILFIVLIGLIQSAKEIQKHLKLDLENQIRKRKLLFLPPPSFWPERPSRPAAVSRRAGPHVRPLLPPPSWAGPSQPQPMSLAPVSFPLPLTSRVHLSAPSSTSRRLNAVVKAQPPPAPTSFCVVGAPTPRPL